MAKQLPIIARTNKSGFELLTVHKCQTLVLPNDDSVPNFDVSLTLHSEAQEIIDNLSEAVERLLPAAEDSSYHYGSDPLGDDDIVFARAALAKSRGEDA